jgi:hypothetical protein
MTTDICSFQKLRRLVHVAGLIFAFALNSCTTPPKLNSQKTKKVELERQTSQIFIKISATNGKNIREKLNRFNRSLNRKSLSEEDWKLHDVLLDYYIELKRRGSSTVTIPAKSRLTLPLETYCLNSGKAAPEPKEVYHWQKGVPGIKYYSELLNLRRLNQITQHELQELLWNLQNETRWEDYPDKLKVILQKIDSNAASKLPSRVQDQVKGLVTDSLLSLPGIDDAWNSYNLIKGKYYEYDDFKRSVERLTSKAHLSDYDDLTKIPDTELYSQNVSEGYASQNITFYNPTDRPQNLDLEKYYLAPERSDVQLIGINPILNDDPKLLSDLEKALYETMARLGIGFTPVVNDIADLFELLTGKDFLNGNPLSPFDRTLSGFGVVAGSGATYRFAKRAIYAPTRYIDDFSSGLKKIGKSDIPLGTRELAEAERPLGAANEIARNARNLKKYGALATGPLHNIVEGKGTVADTFRSSSYEGYKNRKSIPLYRVQSTPHSTGKKLGSYWTREKPLGPLQSQIDSALDPEFKNSAKHWIKIVVPEGEMIYEGRAAAQKGLVGGGSQIYLEKASNNWFVESGEFK